MNEIDKTMDLLYINPSQNLKEEIEKLGGRIEDASDYIHTERVAIYYPKNKEDKYRAILKKFKVINNSLSYLINPPTLK